MHVNRGLDQEQRASGGRDDGRRDSIDTDTSLVLNVYEMKTSIESQQKRECM